MPNRHTPEIESPSASRTRGAASLPHQLDEAGAKGSDQDIDTAGTEADPLTRPEAATARPRRSSPEGRAEAGESAARTDPKQARQDRNVEEPGDTDSADIVGRTGEQMPRQSHDGLESDKRKSRTRETDDNVDETPRTSGGVS